MRFLTRLFRRCQGRLPDRLKAEPRPAFRRGNAIGNLRPGPKGQARHFRIVAGRRHRGHATFAGRPFARVAILAVAVGIAIPASVMPVARAGGNANLHLDKSVTAATLAPVLALTLASDKGSAIPGDTITYSATLTNTGAIFTVSGDLTAQNTNATQAEVASYFDTLATSDIGQCTPKVDHGHTTQHWTPFAGTATGLPGYTPVDPGPTAPAMTLTVAPVPATGVTYPTTGDRIVGTQLNAGAAAVWHYQATVSLTPTQAGNFLDRAKVAQTRNTFHAEVLPRAQQGQGQPDTVDNTFCQLFTGSPNATASSATVTITLPRARHR